MDSIGKIFNLYYTNFEILKEIIKKNDVSRITENKEKVRDENIVNQNDKNTDKYKQKKKWNFKFRWQF